jgi:hypothetical protein
MEEDARAAAPQAAIPSPGHAGRVARC